MAKSLKKSAENGVGHNSDAREMSLHRHMAAMRVEAERVDQAKAILDKAKAAFKVVRNTAREDGWTLKILDKALDVERGNGREAQRQADEEHFVFTMLGLPVAVVQGDLFGAPADEKRDEEFWGNNGYNAGLRGWAAEAPSAMPPQFLQTWLKRHVAGKERLAWAQAPSINPEREDLSGTDHIDPDDVGGEKLNPLLSA